MTPPVVALGPGRLRRMRAYAAKVFGLPALLAQVRDTRQAPQVPTGGIVRILVLLGLLRVRSFNALEPKLAEPAFRRALGQLPGARRLCSADTLGYALARMDVASTRRAVVQVVRKAERNKVFREGWWGSLRVVALDGWEPICSRHRHCAACLTRQVPCGPKVVTEYYHAYVVALLLGARVEVVLDVEPIRSADVRREAGEVGVPGHEGELTAAKRMVPRRRATYGRWLDVLVVDALYSNGPFLTAAAAVHFGVIAVLKKATDEPLTEALAGWRGHPPDKVVVDDTKREHVLLWDRPGVATLRTYDGPIRVVRGDVHKDREGTDHTWCFAVTGVATRLSARQVLTAGRGRWHLENTGFHQWITCWHFGHVFTHDVQALQALLWLFFLAFNLLQLFLYRQLGGYGRDCGTDVTRTILRRIDEMCDEVARLATPVAWDTS